VFGVSIACRMFWLPSKKTCVIGRQTADGSRKQKAQLREWKGWALVQAGRQPCYAAKGDVPTQTQSVGAVAVALAVPVPPLAPPAAAAEGVALVEPSALLMPGGGAPPTPVPPPLTQQPSHKRQRVARRAGREALSPSAGDHCQHSLLPCSLLGDDENGVGERREGPRTIAAAAGVAVDGDLRPFDGCAGQVRAAVELVCQEEAPSDELYSEDVVDGLCAVVAALAIGHRDEEDREQQSDTAARVAPKGKIEAIDTYGELNEQDQAARRASEADCLEELALSDGPMCLSSVDALQMLPMPELPPGALEFDESSTLPTPLTAALPFATCAEGTAVHEVMHGHGIQGIVACIDPLWAYACLRHSLGDTTTATESLRKYLQWRSHHQIHDFGSLLGNVHVCHERLQLPGMFLDHRVHDGQGRMIMYSNEAESHAFAPGACMHDAALLVHWISLKLLSMQPVETATCGLVFVCDVSNVGKATLKDASHKVMRGAKMFYQLQACLPIRMQIIVLGAKWWHQAMYKVSGKLVRRALVHPSWYNASRMVDSTQQLLQELQLEACQLPPKLGGTTRHSDLDTWLAAHMKGGSATCVSL
jgi:hypothetical protein